MKHRENGEREREKKKSKEEEKRVEEARNRRAGVKERENSSPVSAPEYFETQCKC